MQILRLWNKIRTNFKKDTQTMMSSKTCSIYKWKNVTPAAVHQGPSELHHELSTLRSIFTVWDKISKYEMFMKIALSYSHHLNFYIYLFAEICSIGVSKHLGKIWIKSGTYLESYGHLTTNTSVLARALSYNTVLVRATPKSKISDLCFWRWNVCRIQCDYVIHFGFNCRKIVCRT